MNTFIARTFVLLTFAVTALHAQVPQLINYQGRVAVHGVNFDGPGKFKFAIVDAAGTTSYWSNDGTSTAGSEPAAAIRLSVTGGLYSVLLGDTSLPNMAAIPAGAFKNSGVLLRVWFDDGTNGSQLLTPDQSLPSPAGASPVHARHARDGGTATDAWQLRAGGTAPAAREWHTTVWTGSEMIVWGGYNGSGALNDGGRYDPVANSWTAVTTAGAPSARRDHTAVWTGSEMIVWGGYGNGPAPTSVARYHPAANSWTVVATAGAPVLRWRHTAVWTGSEMIVWGGDYGSPLNDGGCYDPVANTWTAVTTTGAPLARIGHTAVWTGSEMIVWGGEQSFRYYYNDGGRYDPVANTWTAVNPPGAPGGRVGHTAVWTGSEMIVWGGYSSPLDEFFDDGGRYNPSANTWTAVSPTGAPVARFHHTAVWTGSEMIVWGGAKGGLIALNNGGRFHPASGTWTAVTTTGAATARFNHAAEWTGSEMIIWGGLYSVDGNGTRFYNLIDTFSYTPVREAFRVVGVVRNGANLIISFPSVPACTYTLWRSDVLAAGTWEDTGLTALTGTGATLTFTVPAGGVPKRFFRVEASP